MMVSGTIMKPSHLLPPLAALAVCGLWLGFRERSISTLEEGTALLRQHVELAGSGGADNRDRSLATARAREKKEVIDWRRIAGSQAAAEGKLDLRERLQLQARLQEMTGAELLAALDEIAALDLDEAARLDLEGALIGVLAGKDPQAALERYSDRIGDARIGLSSQLSDAFQEWASKDRNAALAWFDARIAEGKFESKALDGKSADRLRFESSAISALMEDDSAAASRRLAALPEGQRAEVLHQSAFVTLKPGSEAAFARLVREHVAEDRRGGILAYGITMMLDRGGGGYGDVGKFLGAINATPAERKDIVKQAARSKMFQIANQGGLDRKAVDEMRAWAAAESPGNADSITGDALANGGGPSGNWQVSARIVGELQEASPGDDLLVSFLRGHGTRLPENREVARELAVRITDETKRNEVLTLLGN